MTQTSGCMIRLLGRIYFIAIIPFFGGALASWILPENQGAPAEFLLWSFTLLIFCSAGWLGYTLGAGERLVALHTFVSLAIGAGAVAAYLVARAATAWGLTLLLMAHGAHLLWVRKTSQPGQLLLQRQPLDPDILKQHQRFVWTLLACHAAVILSLLR